MAPCALLSTTFTKSLPLHNLLAVEAARIIGTLAAALHPSKPKPGLLGTPALRRPKPGHSKGETTIGGNVASNLYPLLDVDSRRLNLAVDSHDTDMQLLKDHWQSIARRRECDGSGGWE